MFHHECADARSKSVSIMCINLESRSACTLPKQAVPASCPKPLCDVHILHRFWERCKAVGRFDAVSFLHDGGKEAASSMIDCVLNWLGENTLQGVSIFDHAADGFDFLYWP